MLLDIGNTNIKVFDEGKIARYEIKNYIFPMFEFYYINVNPKVEKLLESMPQAINIASWFDLQTAYNGMGIDRIAACYAIEDGVIVDAGSAITVDVMKEGLHQGGYILPGFRAYKESFAKISSKLKFELNKELNLEQLPLNTTDALSYATLKSIVLMIQKSAEGKKIYLTGGDGKILGRYLKNSLYDNGLVFKGMQKAIKEKEC